MPLPPSRRRLLGLLGLPLMGLLPPALAQEAALPAPVRAALQQARLPPTALSVVVTDLGRNSAALEWQAAEPRNPASVFKLVTTMAALDRLGPAWTWGTDVVLDGPVRDGVLEGSVALRGSGDPTLVLERAALLLLHLQQRGVRHIRGDIVLDRSAWSLPLRGAGEFDGEPSKPYNVQPDVLLFNHKALTLRLTPQPDEGRARVAVEPTLAGLTLPDSVPLSAGPCGDWRSTLKADWSDPGRIRLAGTMPAECGEREWPVAYADPASYNARFLTALWAQLGGRLDGQVREGTVPPQRTPAWSEPSPPLSQVVRDINKFSNNLMAEQLFLTLGALTRPDAQQPATLEDARGALQVWLKERLGEAELRRITVDNGSGLSRETRISAAQLARLLRQAWDSPVMPDLVASLPASGVDGTLRRARVSGGRAHLKTGSLKDVAAVAGYVLSRSGRRYVLVALLNAPQAGSGRAALEALTQWVMDDLPAP